jgi:hypothetical protein
MHTTNLATVRRSLERVISARVGGVRTRGRACAAGAVVEAEGEDWPIVGESILDRNARNLAIVKLLDSHGVPEAHVLSAGATGIVVRDGDDTRTLCSLADTFDWLGY